MKRSVKLLCLLLVLVVFIAAYYIMTMVNARLAAEEAEKAEEDAQIEVYELFDINADSIVKLEFSEEAGGVVLEAAEDETWRYTADDAFPLNEPLLIEVLENLSYITASMVIESPTDLVQYGFDGEESILSVTDAGNNRYTFRIGDYNNFAAGYYLMIDGSDNVYVIDETVGAAMALSLMDFVEMEEIPEMQAAIGLNVDFGDHDLDLYYLGGNTNYTFSEDCAWFVGDGPEEDPTTLLTPLDTASAQSLFTNVSNLAWTSCAAYNASDEELAAFGFGDGAVAVTAAYMNQVETTDLNGEAVTTIVPGVFAFEIGGTTEDGSYVYVRLPESRMVYTTAVSGVQALQLADRDSMRQMTVIPVTFDDFKYAKITVPSAGVDTQIRLSRETSTAADGTETTEIIYKVGTFNAKDPVAAETFVKTLLICEASALAGGDAAEQITTDPVMTMIIGINSETFPEMPLTFREFDEDTYLASFFGKDELLVDRSFVDSLIESVTAIAATEVK